MNKLNIFAFLLGTVHLSLATAVDNFESDSIPLSIGFEYLPLLNWNETRLVVDDVEVDERYYQIPMSSMILLKDAQDVILNTPIPEELMVSFQEMVRGLPPRSYNHTSHLASYMLPQNFSLPRAMVEQSTALFDTLERRDHMILGQALLQHYNRSDSSNGTEDNIQLFALIMRMTFGEKSYVICSEKMHFVATTLDDAGAPSFVDLSMRYYIRGDFRLVESPEFPKDDPRNWPRPVDAKIEYYVAPIEFRQKQEEQPHICWNPATSQVKDRLRINPDLSTMSNRYKLFGAQPAIVSGNSRVTMYWDTQPETGGSAWEFVAVKVIDRCELRSQSIAGPEFIENELMAQFVLSHPNILTAKEVVVHERQIIMISEASLVPSLHDAAISQSLSPIQIRQLVKDIASALAYIHARGYMHRDVKPANILQFGTHYKLIDFGFVCSSRGNHSIASGTPYFMAPEQYEYFNRSSYDERIDIYSFGVTLAAIALGWLPTVEENIEFLNQPATHRPFGLGRPRSDFPLGQLLYRMLQRNPDDRISAEDILQSEYIRRRGAYKRGYASLYAMRHAN